MLWTKTCEISDITHSVVKLSGKSSKGTVPVKLLYPRNLLKDKYIRNVRTGKW